jgi:GTP-binding protein
MKILKSEYLISSPTYDMCPVADRPEYAFIGRSNVGKSSLINMLCNKQGLAKTSGTPGKTQLINHFDIVSLNEAEQRVKWYLVDLPGYGYAKVGKGQRKTWKKMIADYLQKRDTIRQIFILIDSRHSPQKIDIEFINQLGEWQKPFCILFTKSDKIRQQDVAANVKAFMTQLSETWEELPGYFITSAVKNRGAKEILSAIEQINAAEG